MIKFETGSLDPSDLEAMLNSLPGDVTFVGKDDRILYYNEPRERLFGRTKDILGTSVQSCHPSKSVPAVDKVLNDLRSGKSESVEFRIDLRGKPVWIRYIAVRSPKGEYLGCLELATKIGTPY